MRAVNLIPADERRGESAPTRTGPLVYVLIGALALTLIAVYLVVTTANTISARKAEVAVLEQDVASAQARVTALRSFADFASLEEARAETINSLARSRFDWERVLRELALVIPADVELDSLNGSIGADADGDAAATGGTVAAPQLTMTGCADGHESVAQFVAALRDIDGVTRVGLSNSQEEDADSDATTSGDGAGAECSKGATTFELVAAFDDVAVDAAAGGIVPTDPEEVG